MGTRGERVLTKVSMLSLFRCLHGPGRKRWLSRKVSVYRFVVEANGLLVLWAMVSDNHPRDGCGHRSNVYSCLGGRDTYETCFGC